MKALRKVSQGGLTRQLDAVDLSRRVHEYPAVAAPTWVVDTGASYDVVPTGVVAAKNWDRVSLREPLCINTANGQICVYPRGGFERPGHARRNIGGRNAEYTGANLGGETLP